MSKHKKTAIAHLPLYMYIGQSGELGKTNYNDCVASFFQYECLHQSKQNVTSLGSLHHEGTEVQRQSTCVCSIHNAV